jgi:hypothetical protein
MTAIANPNPVRTLTARDEADALKLAGVYFGVVNQFATDPAELAGIFAVLKTKKDLKAIGGDRMDAKEILGHLRRLEKVGLVVSEHVNGDRKLTWQCYHDPANEDGALEAAKADFQERVLLPEPGASVRTGRAPGGRGATGPAYTAEQIAAGIEARRSGLSWLSVAQAAGVKSQVYFSTIVRRHNGGIDPKGQPVVAEPKKARRTVKRSSKK